MKKIFISYSWENPKTKSKVLELANKLSNPMIEVILDQWDLKPGHDMNHFMEESVSIADNVLIICDNSYTNKANKRVGGVGTETQIISSDVYTRTKQEKFIPIFFEKNEDGFAAPTFLKSRLGIPLIEETVTEKKVEEIQKMIFNIADNVRASINKTPEFLKNITTDTVTEDNKYSPVIIIDGDSLLTQLSDAAVKQRFIANQLSVKNILLHINKKNLELGFSSKFEEVELIFSKNELSKIDKNLLDLFLDRIKSEEYVFVSIHENNGDSYINKITELIGKQFKNYNNVLVVTTDERFVEEFDSFRKNNKKTIIAEIGPKPSIDIRNVCSKQIDLYKDLDEYFIYSYPSYYIDKMKLENFEDLIANGDDRKNNQLRVYPNGEVFISCEEANYNIKDLQFRWESYNAYNGYVGVRAASNEEYIMEEFEGLKKDWISRRKGYVDYRL